MTTRTAQPLVDSYLERLELAARELPSRQRDDLVADIEEHLGQTLPPDASRADVRLALARLGSPETIVAEALPPVPTRIVRCGGREWVTIVALLFGGVVIPVIGWTIGLVMLWASTTWRGRDKLVGTLLIPGGFALAAIMLIVGGVSLGTECGGLNTGTARHPHYEHFCRSSPPHGFTTGITQTLVLAIVLPVLGALYLALRARPHTVRAYPAGETWVERRGPRETLTITLLLIGGLVIPVVGWLAGVALLWTSSAWDRRERLVGTLLIPGGLAVPLAYLISGIHIGGGGGSGVTLTEPLWQFITATALLLAGLTIPIATAIYLSRRARAHEVHSRFGR